MPTAAARTVCYKYNEADHGARWLRADRGPWRLYCILRDGEWHTSSELHEAYNAAKPQWGEGLLAGWSWDGAKAQLVKRGFRIRSQAVPGRREYRHRLTHFPDGRAVKPEVSEEHLARASREVERRRDGLRDGRMVSRVALTHETAGSSPAPAAKLTRTAQGRLEW